MLTTRHKMAIARLAQIVVLGTRRLVGRGASTQVKRKGVNWELDLHEGIDFSIWLLGSFEPGTVRTYRKLIDAGDTVLDIGANIGAHTLHLAECVGPLGTVVAFEPTDFAFAKLTRNVLLNPDLAARTKCLQFMLVDSEDGTATPVPLYSSWPLKPAKDERHSLHLGRLMSTSGASARTLDSAIAALGLTRVDCIKLDIDGHECAMLRGAGEVMTRWHPTVILELAPYVLEEHGSSLQELVELLVGYGYALFSASTGKPLAMNAAVLQQMIPSGSSLNVLARPALEQTGASTTGSSHRRKIL